MKKLLPILAALALFAAACSGSPDDGGVASLDDTTEPGIEAESEATTGAEDEAAILAFAACMRDNGVEDFEDPVVNDDGSIEFGGFGGGPGADGDTDQETIQAAFQACQDNLEGLAFGPGGGQFDFTEIEDTLVEFAACMRDEGIDMPDPDFSNFGRGEGGGPFGGAIDQDDPEVVAAFEECQDIFAGLPIGGGRLGGGNGGGS